MVNSNSGDNMNENLELLEFIYQSSDMGKKALEDLLKELKEKENKIKSIVSDELKLYEKYYKESQKLAKDMKLEKGQMMSKMASSMSIKKEVKNDNSDAAIAHMLIEGLTMGSIDIDTKINNYETKAHKKVLKLAKDYAKFQRDEIEKLKAYL